MRNRDDLINDLIVRHNNQFKHIKNNIKLTVEIVDKIKSNLSTKKIAYADYKESFDYIKKIFPDVDLAQINIYQASSLLLKKFGYYGVGGFFEKINKTIIISNNCFNLIEKTPFSVKGKMYKDEVLVHELLHYCHDLLGSYLSVALKEEFAYGWSYGYLKNKCYSDDEIIKYNYLPYLYNTCLVEGISAILKSKNIEVNKLKTYSRNRQEQIFNKYKYQMHKKIIELATQKGKEIIRIYKDKIALKKNYYTQKKINSHFKRIDLD